MKMRTNLLVSVFLLFAAHGALGDFGSAEQSTDGVDLSNVSPSIYLTKASPGTYLDPAEPGPNPFDNQEAIGRSWLLADSEHGSNGEGGAAGGDDEEEMQTGNDPRDFATKFMPYYRYTELKNGTTIHEMSLFGLIAISKNFALTYETPIGKQIDITDTDACAGLPDIDCTGSVPGFGTLPNGLPAEGDGVETGVGDTILRLIWDTDWSLWGGALLPGLQLTAPTASDPILGSETMSGGPILTGVWDFTPWPAPGAFWAMMNIYEFDWYKENGRGDVSRFIGRWFLQLPVNEKHKLYIMAEFQPIYDFEESHFSFWVGPEFGKAFTPSKGIFRNGGAIYIKPGFGIGADANSGDRDWSIEVGFRAFWPSRPDAYDMMTSGRL